MRKIIVVSLINALVFSILISLVYSCLSSTYMLSSPAAGEQEVLTGMEAVSFLIRNYGIWSFIQGVLGLWIVMFIGVFFSNIVTCILVIKENKTNKINKIIKGSENLK